QYSVFFFFSATALTPIYTLSLHDALPISRVLRCSSCQVHQRNDLVKMLCSNISVAVLQSALVVKDVMSHRIAKLLDVRVIHLCADRKSTRLNSSHGSISYAVFCLKKKSNK